MASAWGNSWGASWSDAWGTIATTLRLLDVHGAMPPSEFGTELPTPTPQASLPSIEDIEVVNPTYRTLTTNGSLVN